MLPQMMPMPWLIIGLALAVCVFSAKSYISWVPMNQKSNKKTIKKGSQKLTW